MFTGEIWYYTLRFVPSVVTLVNQTPVFVWYMACFGVKMDNKKRCVSMRLDCGHTRDTILGSLINVIGWAYAIT